MASPLNRVGRTAGRSISPADTLLRLQTRRRWTALQLRARLAAAAAALLLAVAPGPSQEQQLQALYARAQAAQREGDLQTAISHLREVVRLVPDLAEAHANLGSLYFQVRDDRQATLSLERALQLKPELVGPHFFLGALTSRRNDFPTAIGHFERAVRLDPTNLYALFYLAEAYFATRRYSDAVSAFERTATLDDFRVDSYYYLSKAHGALSRQALDRLNRTHPSSHFVHLARAHFHEGRRSWLEAAKAYHQALEKNPGAVGLPARLAWARRRAKDGRLDEAVPPPPPGLPTMLGYLYDPPPSDAIEALLRECRGRLARSSKCFSNPSSDVPAGGRPPNRCII